MIDYIRLFPDWEQLFPLFPGNAFKYTKVEGGVIFTAEYKTLRQMKWLTPLWDFDIKYTIPESLGGLHATNLIYEQNVFLIRSPRTQWNAVALQFSTPNSNKYSMHYFKSGTLKQFLGYSVVLS